MKPIFFILLLLTACRTQREIRAERSEVEQLQSIDSVRLLRSEREANDSGRWRRETIYYPQFVQGDRDTTIVRPEIKYITQPLAIIRESGEYFRTSREVDLDSFARAIREEMRATEESKETSTDRRLFPPGVVIALGIGAALFLILLALAWVAYSRIKKKLSL